MKKKLQIAHRQFQVPTEVHIIKDSNFWLEEDKVLAEDKLLAENLEFFFRGANVYLQKVQDQGKFYILKDNNLLELDFKNNQIFKGLTLRVAKIMPTTQLHDLVSHVSSERIKEKIIDTLLDKTPGGSWSADYIELYNIEDKFWVWDGLKRIDQLESDILMLEDRLDLLCVDAWKEYKRLVEDTISMYTDIRGVC